MQTTIDRSNNFDFLRLLFASLVIISHSFPLTGQKEIFDIVTNSQLTLGSLSVDCFFIMSGYLIMMSLQRSKSPYEYLWKRLLRLYPAYIILLIITMLLLPLVYEGKNILEESTYLSYLPNALSLYKIQYQVAGVFENNPYPRAINGSLWSLCYEFTMYLALLCLFPLRKHKYLKFIVLFIFFTSFILFTSETYLLGNTMKKIFLQPTEFYKLCTYFMAGASLVFFNIRKINSLTTRFILFALLIGSLYFNIYRWLGPILLPFFILLAGIHKSKVIGDTGKVLGDISYGVYIYGFLIQQTLVYYFGLQTFSLMIISIIITYIIAFASWHLIEKTSLKYKNIF